jgi:hypothetical protein
MNYKTKSTKFKHLKKYVKMVIPYKLLSIIFSQLNVLKPRHEVISECIQGDLSAYKKRSVYKIYRYSTNTNANVYKHQQLFAEECFYMYALNISNSLIWHNNLKSFKMLCPSICFRANDVIKRETPVSL